MPQFNGNQPAPRTPARMGVEFRRVYGRQVFDGIIKNISVTGVFIEHALRFEKEDMVQIEMCIGNRKKKIKAKVIWSNEMGSGLQFHPKSKQEIQMIDDMIYFIEQRWHEMKGVLNNILIKMA